MAASTRVVLPMPASPVTRRRPVPASRCRRTAVRLGAPASDPGFVSGRSARGCGGVEPELVERGGVTLQCLHKELESAPRWESRRGEHLRDGRVGDPGLAAEGTHGTAILLGGARCAWSAPTRSRCGPMGRLGRGSALKAPPIVQGEGHPSPPQNPLFLPRLSIALPPGTQTAGDAVAIAGAGRAILPRTLACPSREGSLDRRQPRVRLGPTSRAPSTTRHRAEFTPVRAARETQGSIRLPVDGHRCAGPRPGPVTWTAGGPRPPRSRRTRQSWGPSARCDPASEGRGACVQCQIAAEGVAP